MADDTQPEINIAQPLAPANFSLVPGAHDVDHGSLSPVERPSWSETASAAFQEGNTVASYLISDKRKAPSYVEQDFNPWDSIKGTKYEPNWQQFVNVRNRATDAAIKADIDRKDDNERTLAASPWYQSLPMQLLAGTADLPTLLPGGAFVRGSKGGIAVLESGAVVARAAAAGAAVQELGLHTSQPSRTVGESAQAIGASVFLGGLLGAGGARLLSGAEWSAVTKKLEQELAAPFVSTEAMNGSMASAGAETVAKPELEGLTIAGKAAGGLAAATKNLNPALRLLQSPSAEVRDISTKLFENSVYMKQNMEGVASAPAVETLMKEWNGGLANAVKSTNDFFSEYSKGGGALRFEEFRQEIGKAMRRGDVSEIPQVQAAAQEWRSKVFDPLKQAAIDTGQLPADVSVDTAASYFSRMWNKNKLVAQEGQFKQLVQDHYSGVLEQEFSKAADSHSASISRLDQELADLRLAPEERVAESSKVGLSLQKLEETNPDLAGLSDQLSSLRSQSIEAARAGDRTRAADLRQQISELRTQGGDGLTQFQKQRSSLRARQRNIEFGQAGLQERSEQIMSRLADIEEANNRSMERLVSKGQKLEKDLAKLDPQKLQARVSQLRDNFAAEAEKADKAAERARKGVERVKADTARKMAQANTEAQRAATDAQFGAPELAGERKAAASQARERYTEAAQKRDAEISARMEKQASDQAARAERMSEIARRLEAAEGFDRDFIVSEIKGAVSRAARETSSVSLGRGERAARLLERLKTLDPARVEARAKTLAQMKAEAERRFLDRWEQERGALNVDPAKRTADFREAARQIADEVHGALTGRTGEGNRPEFITIKSRGPMKERTFNIPDSLVEDYLEHDVQHVGARYTRVMGADVELARKFGSPDMSYQVQKIRDHYADLRAEAKSEKDLLALGRAEKNDIRDVTAIRDLLRGSYQPHAWEENFATIARNANHLNYIRSMGEPVLASLTDTVRIGMVHGLKNYMTGIGQLMTNLDAVRLSVKEAQLAGNVLERVLAHRLATIAEIVDPYAARGPIEKTLENLSNVASKWNGIRLWTDGMKSMAAVLTQNRVLKGVENFGQIKQSERAYLAFLGIDQGMGERILAQFRQHGQTLDGVRVAGTENWTDEVARRTYRAAVNKDVDSVIIQKSVADVPLFANTALGRSVLQFKSFTLASHQKVLMRGLQEDQSRMVGGMVAMTSMGMFQVWLKGVFGNRSDKNPEFAANPGWWIGEGVDKSGIVGPLMEVSNVFEKMTGVNPVKSPVQAFDQQNTESQKIQNRSIIGALVGPTAGLIDDTTTVAGIPRTLAAGDDVNKGQKAAAERLIPFNSYFGMRQLLRYVINPPD
jgi:hypothetical protein